MISVFFSYSRKDIAHFPNVLEAIKTELERLSNGACELILDSFEKELPGSSLQEFESKITDSDVVLILWGEHYASSVGTTRQSAQEYQRAIDAHEAGISVIPITLAKSARKDLPYKLRDIVAFDLSFMNDPDIEKTSYRLAEEVDRMWAKISRARSSQPRSSWNLERQAVSFLFTENRAQFNEKAFRPFVDRLIVKPHFSTKLTGNTGFLVGRKGVGKSATTQAMPIMAFPPVREVIAFSFDKLDWGRLVRLIGESRGDDYIFGETARLKKAWEALFLFMIAFHHKYQIETKTKEESVLFKATENLMDREAFGVAFTLILETAGKLAIDFKEKQHLHPHAGSSVAEAVLGHSLYVWLERYLRRQTGREICLVGDNFDYRVRMPQDASSARHYLTAETNILVALAEFIVTDFPNGESLIPSQACRFIVAIPNDRMLIIRGSLRDAIKTEVCSLYWTGIELTALLRKRIAAFSLIHSQDYGNAKIMRRLLANNIWRSADPKNKEGHRRGGLGEIDRLSARLEAIFPELPVSVDFVFNEQKISLSLFSYVLRHTLWRPRDILYFFSSLVLEALAARRRGEKVTTDQVRQLIALRTKTLVKDEVIAEYRDFHTKIEDALDQFNGAPQTIKGNDFKNRVSRAYSISGRKEVSRESDADVENTKRGISLFKELFELGLLGFLPQDPIARRDTGHQWAFSFHLRPVRLPVIEDFDRAELCFHPILTEYLHLDTSKNLFLLNYNNDWLVEQDRWVESNMSLLHDLAQAYYDA